MKTNFPSSLLFNEPQYNFFQFGNENERNGCVEGCNGIGNLNDRNLTHRTKCVYEQINENDGLESMDDSQNHILNHGTNFEQ